MHKYAADPKFPLGNVVITGRAAASIRDKPKLLDWLLARHQSGDWGNVSEDDKLTNDAAIAGYALHSAYRANDGTEFWVITEANRKITTVLLPDDY